MKSILMIVMLILPTISLAKDYKVSDNGETVIFCKSKTWANDMTGFISSDNGLRQRYYLHSGRCCKEVDVMRRSREEREGLTRYTAQLGNGNNTYSIDGEGTAKTFEDVSSKHDNVLQLCMRIVSLVDKSDVAMCVSSLRKFGGINKFISDNNDYSRMCVGYMPEYGIDIAVKCILRKKGSL